VSRKKQLLVTIACLLVKGELLNKNERSKKPSENEIFFQALFWEVKFK